MDSIEKINNYNLRYSTHTNTVVLKKKNLETKIVFYILVASYPEELNTINSTKELTRNLYEILKDNKHITLDENVKSVLYCGNLEKFNLYEKVVFMFPYRQIDIRNRADREYRLYTRTLEEQKNTMGFINLCTSAKNSWLSALTKIGTHYGLLLKIEINK